MEHLTVRISSSILQATRCPLVLARVKPHCSPLFYFRRMQDEAEASEPWSDCLLHGATALYERRHQSHGGRYSRRLGSIFEPSGRLLRRHFELFDWLSRCKIILFLYF